MVGLVFIVYQAFIVPYRIGFEASASKGLGYFETIQDFYFIADIFINFNTGVYNEGVKVMKRRETILIYLKSWFFLDLIASFPYDWVISGSISPSGQTGTT